MRRQTLPCSPALPVICACLLAAAPSSPPTWPPPPAPATPDVVLPGSRSIRSAVVVRVADDVRRQCAVGHRIGDGETLRSLAGELLGDPGRATEIASLNVLDDLFEGEPDPDRALPAGRIVWIPPLQTAAEAAATAEEAGTRTLPRLALLAKETAGELEPLVPYAGPVPDHVPDRRALGTYGHRYGVQLLAVPLDELPAWERRRVAWKNAVDAYRKARKDGKRASFPEDLRPEVPQWTETLDPASRITRTRQVRSGSPTHAMVHEVRIEACRRKEQGRGFTPVVERVQDHHYDADGQRFDRGEWRNAQLLVFLVLVVVGIGGLVAVARRRREVPGPPGPDRSAPATEAA